MSLPLKMKLGELAPAEFLILWWRRKLLPKEEQTVLEKYYERWVRFFPPYLQRQYNTAVGCVMDMVEEIGADDVKLLDIGCGVGSEALYFALRGIHVDAIDVRPDYLRVAKCRERILRELFHEDLECNFWRSSVFDFQGQRGYDVIWISETFHHVEPREQFVPLIHELLAPGGYVVIHEANGMNLFVQLLLLKRRGFRTKKIFTSEDGQQYLWGEERVLSARSLVRLLGNVGLKTYFVKHFRFFPKRWLPDSWMLFIENSVPQYLSFLAVEYVVVARRLSE